MCNLNRGWRCCCTRELQLSIAYSELGKRIYQMGHISPRHTRSDILQLFNRFSFSFSWSEFDSIRKLDSCHARRYDTSCNRALCSWPCEIAFCFILDSVFNIYCILSAPDGNGRWPKIMRSMAQWSESAHAIACAIPFFFLLRSKNKNCSIK